MRKIAFLLCLVPSLAFADAAEDKGWLVNWLQDNLSGAGRRVEIDGFEGALSSQASLAQMTIADDQGVWLTLKGVKLDWSRSALLSGRIEVNALSAEEIDLDRLPASQATTSPEAKPFALPELPVSIAIAGVSAPVIKLGPSVLGEEIVASLSADLTLEGGAGQGHLNLARKDAGGQIALSASYGNTEGILSLNLLAEEPQGGLAARKLGVPGAPATRLAIKGAGPLTDFTAQVDLATDGVTRLGGLVTVKEGAFSALLAGDPTPVFLPRYAEFFGPNVALQVKGSQGAEGLTLERLELQAAALTLSGKAHFAPGGRPDLLDVTAKLGLDHAVTLPLTTPVTVASGELRLTHDATQGPGWALEAGLQDLVTGTLSAAHIGLSAKGDLGAGVFDGTASLTAEGLAPQDPALARALGSTLQAAARFRSDDKGLQVQDLSLAGPGLELTTLGRIGTDGGFQGEAKGRLDDLTRLSGYREGLKGAVSFDLTGSANALSGAFDLVGTLVGQGLAVGQAEADAFLKGDSRIAVSALRDETGLTLRQVQAEAGGLTAALSGTLTSAGADVKGQVSVADLAVIGREGQVSARVEASGTLDTGRIALSAKGQGLGIGQAEADKLLAGASSVDLTARSSEGALTLDSLTVKTDQLAATASGPVEAMQVQARLANLGLFVPEFPGPLTVSGQAGWKDAAVLDLKVQGPGQIAATVAGRLGEALTAKGTAAAALANPFLRPRSLSGGLRFDLVLRELSLAGLSGRVDLTGGRFADPSLPFGLTEMAATVQLASGRATLTQTAKVTTGGSVSAQGSLGLSAPYAADIGVTLTGIKLRDPQLYETSVSGTAAFKGPALGGATVSGALSLGRTELRIPSTLGTAAMLPVTHRGDSPAMRATRARAEGDATNKGGGAGPGYGLNIKISAPNQVFLRGRGLDAELGGALTLGGTTNAIVPQGGFSLLRGRMDILGRRLTLSEANLDLQGALVPTVHVVASVEASDITAIVTIDGPATSPEVTFTSSPALPQEEVIAQLLFGQGLEQISAFQAAQLASAVATLAGKGGEGIMGKIRSKTGLDNLDVQTDATGGASLTAGKYISEKVYSEVTVDSAGKSEVSLNLDVARHITLKAKVDTEGKTGAGIFLKKDY